MKKFLIAIKLVSACILFFGSAIAQEQPPAPLPPVPPPAGMEDTSRIQIGNRQILIITSKTTKDTTANAESGKREDWTDELERELEAAGREIEEAMRELKRELSDSTQSHTELEEARRELDQAKRELEDARRELDDARLDQDPDRRRKRHRENIPPIPEVPSVPKKKKVASMDFLDIEAGLNYLDFGSSITETTQSDLDLKNWPSPSFTLTFFPTRFYLGSRNVMLRSGLSWRISQFEFREKLVFEPGQTLVYSKDTLVKKSQFMAHYLQLPLNLYVESNKIRGLGRIGAGLGAYAGVLLHQEHELTLNNPKRFIETEENFGFAKIRYGLSAHLDIGAFKLFGKMDLNDLWDDSDIRNLECGLWITL
ncbi:MAG: hypothetical protein IT266_06425 [Saprospiraceae bacterium]|nr:hypothetical protein [Saprospiraceae bacterium]